MRFGTNLPRSTRTTRRNEAFRPKAELLEDRQLMTVDLSTVASAPLGVLQSGKNSSGGAGYSVTAVGDVNGDGYDDYVIGAPTVVTKGNTVSLGSGAGTRAYLVLGSNSASAGTVDFLSLNTQQRVGDIANLGNLTQNNPVNGNTGFAFNGLVFETSQSNTSELGASVAALGDINGDGYNDFLIGAPGANDANNNNNGAGRAYLVYGSANLNRTTKLVDLDTPTSYTDLNILTFANTLSGAASGFSVGSAGNVLADGHEDIAIGAPQANISGVATGAVYVVSGTDLTAARTGTILLNDVGQPANNVPGVILTGAQNNDVAGWAVADAGDISGANAGGAVENDLLIGAPQISSGAGEAYLIYSNTNLAGAAVTANNYTFVSLNSVGGAVPGAVFTGAATGDETGYSLSTAGNYTGTTLSSFLIGSPGYTTDEGRVTLVIGQATGSTNALSGPYSLTTLVADGLGIEYDGDAGSFAGTSVGSTYTMTTNSALNDILIGAPGENAGAGEIYILPGNPSLAVSGGTYNLSTVGAGVLGGLQATLTDPSGAVDHLGTSVGGFLALNAQNRTGDSDELGDIVVGAPGIGLYGGGYILEGGLLSSQIVAPVSTGITSPIGVGTVFAPFNINATSPPALRIYILSAGSNTADFEPFRDIDPTTIKVNGIPLPDPTTWTEDIDEDGDGIRDAYFDFNPRSLLGLTTGTANITVTAKTLATSPFANRSYTGTATVTVTGGSTGGGGTGGGGLASTRGISFSNLGAGVEPDLPFGEQLVPSETLFHQLNYVAVPESVAHKEFLPKDGFGIRTLAFTDPKKYKNPTLHGGSKYGTDNDFTLGNGVATRGLSPGTHAYKGKTRSKF